MCLQFSLNGGSNLLNPLTQLDEALIFNYKGNVYQKKLHFILSKPHMMAKKNSLCFTNSNKNATFFIDIVWKKTLSNLMKLKQTAQGFEGPKSHLASFYQRQTLSQNTH